MNVSQISHEKSKEPKRISRLEASFFMLGDLVSPRVEG
jgi:hypothetical protein